METRIHNGISSAINALRVAITSPSFFLRSLNQSSRQPTLYSKEPHSLHASSTSLPLRQLGLLRPFISALWNPQVAHYRLACRRSLSAVACHAFWPGTFHSHQKDTPSPCVNVVRKDAIASPFPHNKDRTRRRLAAQTGRNEKLQPLSDTRSGLFFLESKNYLRYSRIPGNKIITDE